MIVVLIIGVLLSIALPSFINARENSRAKACINNLSDIDSAKCQWIMDHNASTFANATYPGDSTLGGLVPSYIRTTPNCPESGTYQTGNFTALPTCSIGTSSIFAHELT